MKIKTYSLFLLLCCFSCNNLEDGKSGKAVNGSKNEIEFDKNKWMIERDDVYPYRDKMLKDLMGNGKLKGLKKDKVSDLLGQPTRSDTSYLFYRIAQQRIGFFPLHTKTLVIKFTGDTTVEWVKIHQ